MVRPTPFSILLFYKHRNIIDQAQTLLVLVKTTIPYNFRNFALYSKKYPNILFLTHKIYLDFGWELSQLLNSSALEGLICYKPFSYIKKRVIFSIHIGEKNQHAVRRNSRPSTIWWTLGVMVVTPVTTVPSTLCPVWMVTTASRALLAMNNLLDHSVVLLVVLHIIRRLQVRSVDSPHGP